MSSAATRAGSRCSGRSMLRSRWRVRTTGDGEDWRLMSRATSCQASITPWSRNHTSETSPRRATPASGGKAIRGRCEVSSAHGRKRPDGTTSEAELVVRQVKAVDLLPQPVLGRLEFGETLPQPLVLILEQGEALPN